ncbi:MAG: hypothetical protein ACOX7R_05865 [Acetivibrionales bacterium]
MLYHVQPGDTLAGIAGRFRDYGRSYSQCKYNLQSCLSISRTAI